MTDAEKIKAALAEAGYPGLEVETGPPDDKGRPYCCIIGTIPDEVRWMAYLAARCVYVCWPCWREFISYPDCEHDPYTSERPVLVRR